MAHPTGSFIIACIMLLVCILGAVGNVLAICVFLRGNFRQKPFFAFLVGLSIVDLLFILVACPYFGQFALAYKWHELMVTYYGTHATDYILIYIYPLVMILQSATVWLTVVICLERFQVICHPIKSLEKYTKMNAVYTICGVVFAAFVYNVVRFWEYSWQGKEGIALLRNSTAYWSSYATVAYFLTQYIGPLGATFVSGGLLLAKCVKQRQSGASLNRGTQEELAITHMWLAVALVFFICYTLSFLLKLVEFCRQDIYRTAGGHILVDLNNILVLVNSASSILFYVGICKEFRQEIINLFKKCCFTRSYRETEYANSLRYLDRRETGSLRVSELTEEERLILKKNINARRSTAGVIHEEVTENQPGTSGFTNNGKEAEHKC